MATHSIPTDILTGPAPLRGQLILPVAPPQRAILINGATGIPHGYYTAFARWLAKTKTAVVLTYDYRDFGASARGPVKRSTATMADWGITDQQTARDWLSAEYADLPLWVVGHSLGGFMLPWQTGLDRIARLIAVASGPVHVSDHPWPYQAVARAFWYGHGPVLTRLQGYCDGRTTGLKASLPAGVYWQWRRWCTDPAFADGHLGPELPDGDMTGYRGAAHLVPVSDDPMIPPPVVARLRRFYQHADITETILNPADFGLRKIGHIPAFAHRTSAVWPAIMGHYSASSRI